MAMSEDEIVSMIKGKFAKVLKTIITGPQSRKFSLKASLSEGAISCARCLKMVSSKPCWPKKA